MGTSAFIKIMNVIDNNESVSVLFKNKEVFCSARLDDIYTIYANLNKNWKMNNDELNFM